MSKKGQMMISNKNNEEFILDVFLCLFYKLNYLLLGVFFNNYKNKNIPHFIKKIIIIYINNYYNTS